MLGCFHFRERKMEGQGGFRPLIFTHPVVMESITAPTCAEIVERETEVIAS